MVEIEFIAKWFDYHEAIRVDESQLRCVSEDSNIDWFVQEESNEVDRDSLNDIPIKGVEESMSWIVEGNSAEHFKYEFAVTHI